MADGDVVSLMQAQLRQATNEVRDVARLLGINWAIWDEPDGLLKRHKIDRVELAEWLSECHVRETSFAFGIKRFYVEAGESDVPIRSAIVAIHHEVVTVEVMTIKLEKQEEPSK